VKAREEMAHAHNAGVGASGKLHALRVMHGVARVREREGRQWPWRGDPEDL